MKKKGVLLSVMLLVVLAGRSPGAELAGIEIHGFVSQGYLKSDDNNYLAETEDGSFQFNEMGINFGSQLSENLHIGLQLFARDQGAIGNNEMEIDWAYADYRWKDWLGIRAGIMRVAHGFYNETRDLDMLRPPILLPQSIYTESQREAYSRMQGAGLYGEIMIGKLGSLSYQMAAGTINIDEDGGIARQVGDRMDGEVREVDVGTFYNGSLQWHSPFEGLRIGVTGVKTTDMETEIRMEMVMGPPGTPPTVITGVSDTPVFEAAVLSAEYTWENLVVSAEYMYMHIENEIPRMGQTMLQEQTPEGGYIGASYRFTDWFELGAYYSLFYLDRDDRDGDAFIAEGKDDFRAWLEDRALSARFDISDYWTVKLEVHQMDGAAMQLERDNPDGFDEDWYLMAAKVTFSF